MNKHEKRINKNSNYVQREIQSFASMIEGARNASEQHRLVIKELEAEILEREELIKLAIVELGRSEKLAKSISELIQ